MACTRDSGDSSTGAVTVRLRHGDYHHLRNFYLPPPISTGVRTPTTGMGVLAGVEGLEGS